MAQRLALLSLILAFGVSVAFATALQTNATGVAAVVPSSGERICGPAVAHPAAGMTKAAFADATAGQFSKSVSTNH